MPMQNDIRIMISSNGFLNPEYDAVKITLQKKCFGFETN